MISIFQIKGLEAATARKEARNLLKKLHLSEKMYTMSRNLSGGQKRKLCLGMALIGGTKVGFEALSLGNSESDSIVTQKPPAQVVILDEPTSGMDPEARRAIWDLLLVREKRILFRIAQFLDKDHSDLGN